MGNDPSPSPAHLPQIPGKRIWQPNAHHQTPALTLSVMLTFGLALILMQTPTHTNVHKAAQEKSHKNPSPPAKSVCGHTLYTRTHSAGTKPKHTGERQLWFSIWATGCVRLCWGSYFETIAFELLTK